MIDKKEMTAPNVSVGADTEQSMSKSADNSITDNDENIKYFEEMQRESLLSFDQSYLKTISMSELYDTVYQSKPPLIDGMLYPGTYIFAGAPKLGKSFLMAQLAYHISTGMPLWNYTVRKGTVLYLALEDDYHRLQERLYRMFGTETTDNLHFSVSAGQLGNGLDEQLTRFIEEHPDTKLIIIDTLKRVRETGGADYSYGSDYDVVAKLKSLADSYKVTMLIVHHTRKQQADDKFDTISGTNGLLGAADGAFVLSKEKRTANAATLDITGSDQQDQRIHLVRNPQKLIWEFEKSETEVWTEPPDPLLEKVSTVLSSDSSRWDGTASELSKLIGSDIKPNVLSLRLSINAGRLLKDYDIHYKASRMHSGRKISLWKESVSMRDDRDKLSENGDVV